MYTECSQFQFIIINVESVRSPHMFLLSTLYPTFYCGSGRTKVRPFLFFVHITHRQESSGLSLWGREPLRPALGVYGRALRAPTEYGCSVWRAESWPRPASLAAARQFTFSRPTNCALTHLLASLWDSSTSPGSARAQSSCRPSSARVSVTSSTNSRCPPTGMP